MKSIAILFFYVLTLSTCFSQTDKKPNILLIVLDDLNTSVGFLNGHPQVQTPNMDQLAKEGVVFANAHTNAPICAPSRASMLTGVYPHVSKNYWFTPWTKNQTLKNCKSLPKFMGDNGYQTYGTGKIMHHRVKSDWQQFGVKNTFGPYAFNGKKIARHPSMPKTYTSDKNDGLFTSLADVPIVPASDKFPGYKGWYDTRNRKPFKYNSDEDRDLLCDEKSAQWIANKLDSLNNSNSKEPFFMSVGFVRPHTPLVAPQKYFDMYPLETLLLPVIKQNDADDTYYKSTFKWTPNWVKYYDQLKASYPSLEVGLKKYLQAYLACVTFADDQIGTVLKALNNTKFKENTVVVLVSDHGYNHGEKEFLYKNNLWEQTTRIPMVVKAPFIKKSKGTVVSHPVSLIDVYPTIVDFANIKAGNTLNNEGSKLNGFSLKPFLMNPLKPKWKGPNVALSVVRGKAKSNLIEDQSYSVRSKHYRYIKYFNGKEELYNHQTDPHEWNNVVDNKKYLSVKNELEEELQRFLQAK